MFKPNDIVRIEKLDIKDTFPLYGKPFKLEDGDVCRVLVTDFSDEQYPYFLRLGEYEFWLSSDTNLVKVDDDKKSLEGLKHDIKEVIENLNNLLNELDNL